MKKKAAFMSWIVIALLGFGCGEKPEVTSKTTSDKVIQDLKTSINKAPVLAGQPGEKTAKSGLHSGIIHTTMNSGGYSYMEVEENGEKYWVAVPELAVKVGDHVSFPDGSWIQKFQSKGLNRTFDKILFVSRLSTGSSAAGVEKAAAAPYSASAGSSISPNQGQTGGVPMSRTAEAPKAGSIPKVEGGYTVEELYAKKNELKGKVVKVRGKVIKTLPNIMKMNWVHIQDGTGVKGTNDITFTSKTEIAELGTIVVAEGTLAADKNFGAGYLYPAIVEDSTFSK